MSGASQCIPPLPPPLVRCSSSHTVCNQRERERVAQPQSPLHTIGQRYKDFSFFWFFKAVNGYNVVVFLSFCIQSALYLCLVFYNVSFNILMYHLSNLGVQCTCNLYSLFTFSVHLSHDEIIYANKNIFRSSDFSFSVALLWLRELERKQLIIHRHLQVTIDQRCQCDTLHEWPWVFQCKRADGATGRLGIQQQHSGHRRVHQRPS